MAPGPEGELAHFLPPSRASTSASRASTTPTISRKHPKQKVTEIEFRLAYHRFDPDEFFPEGQRNYYFEVLAKVRGKPQAFDRDRRVQPRRRCRFRAASIATAAACCAERSAKPGKILMSFGFYYDLRMTTGCGGEGGELVPGEDDKEFLLTQKARILPGL